jgi:hypothetical protein
MSLHAFENAPNSALGASHALRSLFTGALLQLPLHDLSFLVVELSDQMLELIGEHSRFGWSRFAGHGLKACTAVALI